MKHPPYFIFLAELMKILIASFTTLLLLNRMRSIDPAAPSGSYTGTLRSGAPSQQEPARIMFSSRFGDTVMESVLHNNPQVLRPDDEFLREIHDAWFQFTHPANSQSRQELAIVSRVCGVMPQQMLDLLRRSHASLLAFRSMIPYVNNCMSFGVGVYLPLMCPDIFANSSDLRVIAAVHEMTCGPNTVSMVPADLPFFLPHVIDTGASFLEDSSRLLLESPTWKLITAFRLSLPMQMWADRFRSEVFDSQQWFHSTDPVTSVYTIETGAVEDTEMFRVAGKFVGLVMRHGIGLEGLSFPQEYLTRLMEFRPAVEPIQPAGPTVHQRLRDLLAGSSSNPASIEVDNRGPVVHIRRPNPDEYGSNFELFKAGFQDIVFPEDLAFARITPDDVRTLIMTGRPGSESPDMFFNQDGSDRSSENTVQYADLTRVFEAEYMAQHDMASENDALLTQLRNAVLNIDSDQPDALDICTGREEELASLLRRSLNSMRIGTNYFEDRELCDTFGIGQSLQAICPSVLQGNAALNIDIRLLALTHIMRCTSGDDIRMEVSRRRVFRSSSEFLMSLDPDLLAYENVLSVQFRNEEGIDAGGVFRDWASLFAEGVIRDKKHFKIESGLLTFNESADPASPAFRVVGLFLGFLVRNGAQVPLRLPVVYNAKLLERQIELEDIRFENPELYRGLVATMSMEANTYGDDIDGIKWTVENREDLIKSAINKLPVEDAFMRFKNGFHSVVPLPDLDLEWLLPRDLQRAIEGEADFSIDDVKSNCFVDDDANENTQWLWEFLTDSSAEVHEKFLLFVTGSRRPPVGGFKNLSPRLTIHLYAIPEGKPAPLPSAHTCSNTLDLPKYDCKSTLSDKFITALHADPAMGLS